MNTPRSSTRIKLTALAAALACAALATTLVAESASPAAPPAVPPPSVELEQGTYSSSETCGQCHKDIHGMWASSMHAASFRDPLFQVEFMQALLEGGDGVRKTCTHCHAPTTRFTKDYRAEKAITREGITCDFCHSVSGVKKEGSKCSLILDVGKAKRGPTPNLTSPAHDIQYLADYGQSEFCADCHELINPRGIGVMTTYTEWKEGSPAAEGKSCQSCHMPKTPGSRVVAELRESSGKINLHALPGGKSLAQLFKAVSVQIMETRLSGNKLWVKVRVTNSGSGHAVPTGHPMRKLVLQADLYRGNDVASSRTKTYQRVLGDAKGLAVTSKHDAYLNAVKVLSDNRIRPGQSDEALFDFPVGGSGPYIVEAKVLYLYEPLVLEPHEMKMEMARDRKTVTP